LSQSKLWGIYPRAIRIEDIMCLAIPVLIESVEATQGIIEIGGVKRLVSLMLTPNAKAGDYVLIHAGYAIGLLDEKEARETLQILEQMEALGDGSGDDSPVIA
jgi:hydrogenase expression/formation protein HypC